MTVLDDVSRFVARLSPEPVCDDCVSTRLGLLTRQEASQKARELAGANGFKRFKGACSMCGSTKTVTAKS